MLSGGGRPKMHIRGCHVAVAYFGLAFAISMGRAFDWILS